METGPAITIIGSGIGGATLAAALAPSGVSILILERGERLEPSRQARDATAIFLRGHYRPDELWYEADGSAFSPGNYYYVGGNSKFYGAVMTRYRREDFAEMRHEGGVSPAWPFAYDELEPWYGRAEALYQVRGTVGEDPTEPDRSGPYPHRAVPDEPTIAAIRRALVQRGFSPFSLPLAVDHRAWLAGGATPWDAYPETTGGKSDAETAALAVALAHDNVTLVTGARVIRLETDAGSNRVNGIVYSHDGGSKRISPPLTVLAAGAVNSAALLLQSANETNPGGLANRSDQVGRNFMNHNATAMLCVDPRRRNGAVYQKTLGLNDYYLTDGDGGPPLGNAQLLGKVSGANVRAATPGVPRFIANWIAGHSVDWYLMSEDLPDPESRVRVSGGRIVLEWKRSNWGAHERLVARMRRIFKACGYPIIFTRTFDKRTPSHQCGTVRMGNDPGSSVLDIFCRAHDHENLYVVDAGFLPTSAAVNPALTIAAQALRVADHIVRRELAP